MIKQVNTSELCVGMFVHDLDSTWISHPFLTSRFRIDDEKTIQRIASAGLRRVYIDTARGRDVDAGPSLKDLEQARDARLHEDGESTREVSSIPASVEWERARVLFREATNVVRNLLAASRSGRQVDTAALDPVAERMVQSAFRNPHALSGISRIKTRDEYTFMHCVGVSALLVTFARAQQLPEQQIHDLAIGGLVHDIGKSLVPRGVLNKPGRLDDDEFVQMKDHVTFGRDLLVGVPGISTTSLDVALLHHERMDGSGYPGGRTGDTIGLVGRMSAIVDVYDALTSVRVYKHAWEPTLAMKKLIEWSPAHFDAELVQHFIRCIGIYPIGATVALESGRIAVVIDQGSKLIEPVVRIVYNRKHHHFERPRDIDLGRVQTDRVVEAVNPLAYGIDVTRFL